MIYDSKAILRTKWLKDEDELLMEGWEFVEMINGVVYLRRPYIDTVIDNDNKTT